MAESTATHYLPFTDLIGWVSTLVFTLNYSGAFVKTQILFTALISTAATLFSSHSAFAASASNPPTKLLLEVSQCTGVHESTYAISAQYLIIGRTAPIRIQKSTANGSDLSGIVRFDQANDVMEVKAEFTDKNGSSLATLKGQLSLMKYSALNHVTQICETPQDIGKFNISASGIPARGSCASVHITIDQCLAPAKGKAVKKLIVDEFRTLGASFNTTHPTDDGGSVQIEAASNSADSVSVRSSYTSPNGESRLIRGDFNLKNDGKVSTTRSCLSPDDLGQYVMGLEYFAEAP